MKLIEILDQLDPSDLLNDGADTWDVDNLRDEVRDDDGEYTLRPQGIYRLRADGYQESTPAYRFVEQGEMAQRRV